MLYCFSFVAEYIDEGQWLSKFDYKGDGTWSSIMYLVDKTK